MGHGAVDSRVRVQLTHGGLPRVSLIVPVSPELLLPVVVTQADKDVTNR